METDRLPEAFRSRMQDMLGAEWEAFRDSLEQEEARALRFRGGRGACREEETSRILRHLGAGDPASFVPWAPEGVYLPGSSQPGKALWHDIGAYYIQEPSAMAPAAALDPKPGERVLDLCAAPGGKTTQLAARMGGEGLLVANEIHPARCRVLSQNVERMGIGNCLVTNAEPGELAERLPGFFDCILVDAPCSGEGMFRKNPEAMGEWSPEAPAFCGARQDDILEAACGMLRPGGRMVYSTCTFAPEENEGTISRFLGRHPEFHLEEISLPGLSPGRPEWADGNPELAKTRRLWPHLVRGEGHFAALLVREDTSGPERGGRKKKARGENAGPDRAGRKQIESFLAENLSPGTAENLSLGQWICYGEQVYVLPPHCPPLSGLRVPRPGLQLGSLGRNRFEPSHTLALALAPREVKRSLQLSGEDPRATAWLRGETLSVQMPSGWALVCVDSFGAGWGKVSGGTMKNHVPKGLRRSR